MQQGSNGWISGHDFELHLIEPRPIKQRSLSPRPPPIMRLVTWNCCRGPYRKNASLLDPLAPDIAALQECARPATQTDQCLWFGDNPHQGIAIFAKGPYRIRALPAVAEVPRYAIPVEVIGPTNFVLIAVWSKGGQDNPYIEGVVRAVELYRNLFTQYHTVLLGDLNSNAIWDSSHPADLNHSALVKMLSELGLVSSYHFFHREAHGQEKQPTYPPTTFNGKSSARFTSTTASSQRNGRRMCSASRSGPMQNGRIVVTIAHYLWKLLTMQGPSRPNPSFPGSARYALNPASPTKRTG
jgi:exodeoxyribonuclease III